MIKLERQNSAPAPFHGVSSENHHAAYDSDAFEMEARTPRSGPLEGLTAPSPRLRAGDKGKRPMVEPLTVETRWSQWEQGESSRAASERAQSPHDAAQHQGSEQAVSASAKQDSYDVRCEAAYDRLKAQLRAGLKDRPFAEPSDEQLALQAEYVQWADARLQERIDAFGPDAAYNVAGDMKATGKKASLPIAYECLRSFLTGALRAPLGIPAATAVKGKPTLAAGPLNAASVAGAISGMGSYTCDTLLIPSMDRRARVANLPRFQAVDPKILVPDPPPVLLEIGADGSKHFVRPGQDGTPTHAELAAQAYDRRAGIVQRQSALDDTAVDTMLLRPSINGGFNAARRALANPFTRTALAEFGLSALAVGGASAVQKGMQDTAKAMGRTGQTTVPDLLGGHQRLNLFTLALPDHTRPPAKWSDAVHFPDYLLQTGKEAMAMAKQAFTTANAATTALRDVLGRHMLGNVLTNMTSLGTSKLIGSALRGGYQGSKLPGEADNSAASALQQGAQFFFNDLIWNALKAKNGTNTTQATRLDQERAIAAAELDRTISGRLQTLAEPLDRVLVSLSSPTPEEVAHAIEQGAGVPVPRSSEANTLRDRLQQLRHQVAAQSVSIATIEQVLDGLADLSTAGESQGLPGRPLIAELNAQLFALGAALHKKEQLQQWQYGSF